MDVVARGHAEQERASVRRAARVRAGGERGVGGDARGGAESGERVLLPGELRRVRGVGGDVWGEQCGGRVELPG